MFKHRFLSLLGLVSTAALLLALTAAPSARAQKPQQPLWVGTWATSPMLAQGGFSVHPFAAVTLREVAHISVGGPQIRVRFTNEFGLDGLTIGDAHVALSAGGSEIKEGTDHALTFGGASTVRIPPGAVMYADPVDLPVPPLSDLAVTFYLPSQVMRAETLHSFANQDNYLANGDLCAAKSLTDATNLQSWYFLDGIDVPAPKAPAPSSPSATPSPTARIQPQTPIPAGPMSSPPGSRKNPAWRTSAS